jgi:glycogen debranching enzyme
MCMESTLWDLGFETIKELEIDQGILASGKEEIFGCIFGRDSLITSLKLLRVYENTKDPYFLTLVRKVLHNLASLQGTQINIESGEEPGKCIHEYRPSNHEHLTRDLETPWYLYPDNVMRNYDSIDSTPLFLIALYRYYKASNDTQFIKETLINAELALDWILNYADKNGDGFIDYGLHPDRKYGGLVTQSWMDSGESVFHEDGTAVSYPIAPVEAQSYAFLALRLWSTYFADTNVELSTALRLRADLLKQRFNETFITSDSVGMILATGVDGDGKLMTSARSSMGHCLWASLETNRDGVLESILDERFIPHIVSRLMSPDLFVAKAGIRTLSSLSTGFSSNSYHNGSIWPHDTSIIAEGFDIFGYAQQAAQIREALLYAMIHFNTPVELFVYENEDYAEYCSPHGQKACKKQAWSAAAMMKDSSFTKNS